MPCSSVLKPNSPFYSPQGLISGPVAIATLWQDIARISCNGSPDAVHSAPVEELHSPEETKGTSSQKTAVEINVRLLKLVHDGGKMIVWSQGCFVRCERYYSWEEQSAGGIYKENCLLSN